MKGQISPLARRILNNPEAAPRNATGSRYHGKV